MLCFKIYYFYSTLWLDEEAIKNNKRFPSYDPLYMLKNIFFLNVNILRHEMNGWHEHAASRYSPHLKLPVVELPTG